MNKETIISLLNDGAYLNNTEGRFYHHSFRKGWRKMQWSNISFFAAWNALGYKLDYDKETTIYRMKK